MLSYPPYNNSGFIIAKVFILFLFFFFFQFSRACNLSAMLAIGNSLANSIWEASIRPGLVKPSPSSSREDKEKWIRLKYECKEFLPECNKSVPMGQQLIEAIVR